LPKAATDGETDTRIVAIAAALFAANESTNGNGQGRQYEAISAWKKVARSEAVQSVPSK
jgi:hypothetical protein